MTLSRRAARTSARLFQGRSAEISTLCRVTCQVGKTGVALPVFRGAGCPEFDVTRWLAEELSPGEWRSSS